MGQAEINMSAFNRIIREIKSYWFAGKSGFHHGLGLKKARKGLHQQALKHFFLSIKCDEASRIDNYEHSPIVLESIDKSYAHLKEWDKAKKYAEESLSGYNKMKDENDVIWQGGVNRINRLIKDINSLT